MRDERRRNSGRELFDCGKLPSCRSSIYTCGGERKEYPLSFA